MDPSRGTATIPSVLAAAARRVPETEAVVDGTTRLSYADLHQHVRRFGRALLGSGIEPGDRVAIWAPNSWQWIVAALGVTAVGAVLTPLNTRYLGTEARDLLRRSRARLLVVHGGFLGKDYLGMLGWGEQGVADLPDLATAVDVQETPAPNALAWDAFLARGDGVTERALTDRWEAVEPSDVADILFTSGTTGTPKGALCAHGQNLATYVAWNARVGLRPGDRYLLVNPFFHSFGYKAGVLACLLQGATMLPLPTLDVERVLDLVEREDVSVLPGAPALYTSMLDHPDRRGRRLASVRLAVTGAADVPRSLVERMRDELGFAHVVTAYGLTEVCGTATVCHVDDDPETISTTSGPPIPGVEVRIVDERGRPRPTGTAGEILVRGPNVMQGYFEDPEATAEAIDPGGWLHTGDVGVLDGNGYLTITDRLKDMFIVGGFNTYPAEIERALLLHPAVSEVAVVGIPDERLGEVGCAHVVLRSGARADEDELVAFCRDRMANFKVPRRVVVHDALPRNAMGKVLKHELAP